MLFLYNPAGQVKSRSRQFFFFKFPDTIPYLPVNIRFQRNKMVFGNKTRPFVKKYCTAIIIVMNEIG